MELHSGSERRADASEDLCETHRSHDLSRGTVSERVLFRRCLLYLGCTPLHDRPGFVVDLPELWVNNDDALLWFVRRGKGRGSRFC